MINILLLDFLLLSTMLTVRLELKTQWNAEVQLMQVQTDERRDRWGIEVASDSIFWTKIAQNGQSLCEQRLF